VDGADLVRLRLGNSAEVIRQTAGSDCVTAAVAAADAIARSLRTGGKVLFFGNGGSAMDAGHLAAELLGRFRRERRALAAISLADQTAAMTAIGNDYAYDDVFARQVEGLGRPGDVAVALSTSGTSSNVVLALRRARELGLTTVALTGRTGGDLVPVADICVRVPSDDTPRIQEACLHLGHSICELVEASLPARQRGPLTTVFLDRDGTLTAKQVEGRYVVAPDSLRLLPGAATAVRRLNRAGLRIIVVTNQRAVHRGQLDLSTLDVIHERLRSELAAGGATVDGIYTCPHDVHGCRCRKPLPGLLLAASRDHPDIDLARAVTVGDAETDVAAGIAAGTATVRLAHPPAASAADAVVSDLRAAVDWILERR
jgi:D-sedoheptulose 7-phosphate isomerase